MSVRAVNPLTFLKRCVFKVNRIQKTVTNVYRVRNSLTSRYCLHSALTEMHQSLIKRTVICFVFVYFGDIWFVIDIKLARTSVYGLHIQANTKEHLQLNVWLNSSFHILCTKARCLFYKNCICPMFRLLFVFTPFEELN